MQANFPHIRYDARYDAITRSGQSLPRSPCALLQARDEWQRKIKYECGTWLVAPEFIPVASYLSFFWVLYVCA
jgi:hypothetical protein